MSKEPDWSLVPRPVLRLIQACLEKEPKKRLRDIADGWRLLDEPSTPSAATAAPASRRRMAVAPWAFAAVALFALALLGWRYFDESRPEVRRAQFELTPPDGMSFRDPFAVSPDGRRIAFAVAGSNNVVGGLWVRSLESGEAHALPGTDDVGANGGLFWSPDSRFLAFATTQGVLKKADVENGAIEVIDQLAPVDGFRGGAWTSDGAVLVANSQSGIARLPATGGAATPLVGVGAIEMMAVPVKSGAAFEPGVPVSLFDTRVTGFMPYDVAPDGRFLINTMPANATSRSSITVVVNWFASLDK